MKHVRWLGAVVVAVAGLASCSDRGHARVAFSVPTPAVEESGTGETPRPLTGDGRVILVTLDGVRAEDVFDGASATLQPGTDVVGYTRPDLLMPRTYERIATRGVALGAERPGCGTVRTAGGANVSLPGYLEIFTGRATACRDNGCAPTTATTVLDEAAEAGLEVASLGSWNVLDHAVSRGGTGVFVATGRQRWPGLRPLADVQLEQLVSAGERSEPHPGVGQYRPDAVTMPIALHYLKTQQPTVLHVGLGDADEWGHRKDYASYLAAVHRSDAFIGQLADQLDAMGEDGAKTTVIITTDHGRNADFKDHGPESATSARTFVLAFGARIPVQGVACGTTDITLTDIAPTIRALVGLPADPLPGAGHVIRELLPDET